LHILVRGLMQTDLDTTYSVANEARSKKSKSLSVSSKRMLGPNKVYIMSRSAIKGTNGMSWRHTNELASKHCHVRVSQFRLKNHMVCCLPYKLDLFCIGSVCDMHVNCFPLLRVLTVFIFLMYVRQSCFIVSLGSVEGWIVVVISNVDFLDLLLEKVIFVQK